MILSRHERALVLIFFVLCAVVAVVSYIQRHLLSCPAGSHLQSGSSPACFTSRLPPTFQVNRAWSNSVLFVFNRSVCYWSNACLISCWIFFWSDHLSTFTVLGLILNGMKVVFNLAC